MTLFVFSFEFFPTKTRNNHLWTLILMRLNFCQNYILFATLTNYLYFIRTSHVDVLMKILSFDVALTILAKLRKTSTNFHVNWFVNFYIFFLAKFTNFFTKFAELWMNFQIILIEDCLAAFVFIQTKHYQFIKS